MDRFQEAGMSKMERLQDRNEQNGKIAKDRNEQKGQISKDRNEQNGQISKDRNEQRVITACSLSQGLQSLHGTVLCIGHAYCVKCRQRFQNRSVQFSSVP